MNPIVLWLLLVYNIKCYISLDNRLFDCLFKYKLYAAGNRIARRKKDAESTGNRLESEDNLESFLAISKVLNVSNKVIEDYTAHFSSPEYKAKKATAESANDTLKKRLKKHQSILPEKNVEYPLDDAINRIKLISGCNFVEGIDVAIRIPLTTKKTKSTAGQYAKLVTIPHPSLKSKRCKVGVFAGEDTIEHIKSLDIPKLAFAGGIELIESIKKQGELPDVNIILSDVKTFHKLSLIGKLLGKRGLMPSVSIGTCLETKTDILDILDNIVNRNTFVLKSDNEGDLKCNFADVSMPPDQIRTNLLELIKIVRDNKPPYASQKFISKVFISSSMGPSFKLNLKEIGSIKAHRR